MSQNTMDAGTVGRSVAVVRMKRIFLLTRIIPLFFLVYGQVAVADYPIELIQLKARQLEDVLPVVRSLIGAGETATGMGNNLVLKASPAHVKEIRKLLLEIDRPPKRLLITVSKASDRVFDSSGYSASADIRAGDGQVSVNSPGRVVNETRVGLRIHESSDQRSRNIGQKVQGLEGQPAFVASGSSIPVQSTERYFINGQVRYRQVTQIHDVSSGFYVVPRLSGETVTLEIKQHDDRLGVRRGVIDTQGTSTVVRGRLGEWISLGGINTSSSSSQGGLGRSVTSQGLITQLIEVMVECLDCNDSMGRYREFFPELHGFGQGRDSSDK